MQKDKPKKLLKTLIVVFLFGIFAQIGLTADVPRISKEEFKEKIGAPDVVIVDVRQVKDWTASEYKIKGAVREDPSNINSWSGKYDKDKILILYCA